ncbi:MAG: hypothetical protein WBI40_07060 [Methylococcaceae bacterium]
MHKKIALFSLLLVTIQVNAAKKFEFDETKGVGESLSEQTHNLSIEITHFKID